MKPPTLEIHDTGPPSYSLPVRGEKMHKALPVDGYAVAQPSSKVDVVNFNKQLEERSIRQVERLRDLTLADPRMAAIGITKLQEAWMWINRAVFQPERVKLPEDPEP